MFRWKNIGKRGIDWLKNSIVILILLAVIMVLIMYILSKIGEKFKFV